MKDQTHRPRPVGRPSIYSKAILDEICARLSVGEPLTRICKRPSMPGRSTVYRWIERSAKIAIIRRAMEREGLMEPQKADAACPSSLTGTQK